MTIEVGFTIRLHQRPIKYTVCEERLKTCHAFSRLLPGGGGEVNDADPVNSEVVQVHHHHLAEVRPTPVVARSVSV